MDMDLLYKAKPENILNPNYTSFQALIKYGYCILESQ